MSLFRKQQRLYGINSTAELIPPRTMGRVGIATVNNDTALRHSAVWAALRLRADLISTLPVDVFRRVGGQQIEMPKPPIITNPGGSEVDWCEWMYSSQFDLDRSGNCFGLITEINSLGLPNRIDLQPLAEVSVGIVKGEIAYYRICGKEYDPAKVWHERQFTVAGLQIGLSPVAYAAWAIGEYLSIEQFALDWFSNGGVPSAQLKNTQRTVPRQTAEDVKASFKAAVANRDLWVSGNDWEYNAVQAENMGAEWIEAQQLSVVDIARFFGVPATQIDGAVQGSSITYSNLTQDDLRLMIHHLNPSIIRRENKISAKLLPQPRYIKLNRDALLAMDPKGRAELDKARIDARTLTPDEAREHENQPALTEEQYAQFERLFPPKGAPPGGAPPAAAPPATAPPAEKKTAPPPAKKP